MRRQKWALPAEGDAGERVPTSALSENREPNALASGVNAKIDRTTPPEASAYGSNNRKY